MRPEELGARSAAQRAANEDAVLKALLAAGETGLRPGRELEAASGLKERTCRETVRRLEGKGLLVREGKRRIRATAAARAEVGAGLPGLALAPALDAALACFPAESQRAFGRLLLSAIPARWQLAQSHADGWGGFVLLGPSKTGKTTIAKFVCRIFGLEERQAIRLALEETPGSLFGRRLRGAEGYRFEPSPMLGLPFACIDEWDKADEQTRRMGSGLLLGKTVAELEGEELFVRPTVLLCLNSDRRGLAVLPEAYVRRSVVLDTGALGSLLEDMDEAAYRLFNGTAIPRLALARLRLPAERLPEELRALLRSELKASLTEEGWRLADAEAISRLALGRAALTRGELKQAVLATVVDCLSCAATIGQAQPDFALRLGPMLGVEAPLRPDAKAAAAEANRPREVHERALRQEAAAGLAFEHERERRAAELAEVRQRMGRPGDPEGRALAKTLTSAARRLRGCRSKASLEAIWQEAVPYLEGAYHWLARREEAKRERERIEADTRAAKARELRDRKRWQERRKQLAALIPYEDEQSLFRELQKLGLAHPVPARTHPDPQAHGLRRWWHEAAHPGYWADRHGRRKPAPAVWQEAYMDADRAVVQLGGATKPLAPRQRRTPSNGSARQT
ncbi:MAG TPA: hypothetical protein VF002_05490 [Gaiellaceae bacterium]